MDAVLINPNPSGKGLNEATVEPPLGLAYVAASLEQNGFEVKILDANAEFLDIQETAERILNSNAKYFDLVSQACFLSIES